MALLNNNVIEAALQLSVFMKSDHPLGKLSNRGTTSSNNPHVSQARSA